MAEFNAKGVGKLPRLLVELIEPRVNGLGLLLVTFSCCLLFAVSLLTSDDRPGNVFRANPVGTEFRLASPKLLEEVFRTSRMQSHHDPRTLKTRC